MATSLQKVYNWLIYKGINKRDNVIEKDNKIIINTYAILLILIFLLQGISNIIFLGLTKDSLFLFFIALFLFSLHFLFRNIINNKKNILFIFFLFTILITYYSSLCGLESGVFLFYIPLITTIPIYFNLEEDKKYIIVIFSFILLNVYTSVLTKLSIVPTDSNIDIFLFPLLIINVTCVILFSILNFYISERKRRNYFSILKTNEHKKDQLEKLTHELNSLKKLLNKESLTEENFNDLLKSVKLSDIIFIEHFEKFFPNFFTKIKQCSEKNLSNSDLKYCALLKLGLTTKQIAIYTESTIKAVESKKSRLRKKMGILLESDSIQWFSEI